MSNVITRDVHYKNIASLLRYFHDTDACYKPSEIASSVLNLRNLIEKEPIISNGAYFKNGSISMIGSVLPDGVCAYLDAETVEKIDSYAFSECINLQGINFPSSVTTIGYMSFSDSGLTSVTIPQNVTTIEHGAFERSNFLVNAKIEGNVALADEYIFYDCILLERVDFCGELENIPDRTFTSCSKLIALILRVTSSICALEDAYALKYTPIEKGTGYIYVPSALLDGYKTANNWSTYANQFRALENYTVDGTITGELDENKI